MQTDRLFFNKNEKTMHKRIFMHGGTTKTTGCGQDPQPVVSYITLQLLLKNIFHKPESSGRSPVA